MVRFSFIFQTLYQKLEASEPVFLEPSRTEIGGTPFFTNRFSATIPLLKSTEFTQAKPPSPTGTAGTSLTGLAQIVSHPPDRLFHRAVTKPGTSVKVKRGRQKGDGKKNVRKCHDKSVPFPSNPILSEPPPPQPLPLMSSEVQKRGKLVREERGPKDETNGRERDALS